MIRAVYCILVSIYLEIYRFFSSAQVWRFGGLEVWRFGGLEVWFGLEVFSQSVALLGGGGGLATSWPG